MGQVVAYLRVSSADQNTARQIEAVGSVDRTFEDHVSGKSRAERPGLTECLRYCREGDRLKVASMDRLARSLPDLLALVQELTGHGVEVEFVKEALTFRPGHADPYAAFQLHVLGAVAELERSLIRERQREGIAAARLRGDYAGRGGRPRALSPDQVEEVRQRVRDGEDKSAIARDLGVSRSSVYRALAQPEAEAMA